MYVCSIQVVAAIIVIAIGCHELQLLLCHFHFKGPVETQPLAIASATGAAGQ